MFNWFYALRNAVDFPLRQLFHWQRTGIPVVNEDKQDLFDELDDDQRMAAEEKAKRFLEEYHLQDFLTHSRRHDYQTGLYYLDLLETSMEAAKSELPEVIKVADIGCSDWFYVQTLYAFLKWWRAPRGRRVILDGFEVDPYRVYLDLYSRYDHAQANMRGLRGAYFWPKPFRLQPNTYDMICLFFPFVFLPDHLHWGLPRDLFTPILLIKHAYDSLKPGGFLFIVNQGRQEHEHQIQMLQNKGIGIRSRIFFESLIAQFPKEHFVIVTQPVGKKPETPS